MTTDCPLRPYISIEWSGDAGYDEEPAACRTPGAGRLTPRRHRDGGGCSAPGRAHMETATRYGGNLNSTDTPDW